MPHQYHRQLSGNASPRAVPNHGQIASITTSHRHARSIVWLLLLFAWPNITSDFPTFSDLAPAYTQDESYLNDSTLTTLLHPTPGFRLPPIHHHAIFVWVDILNVSRQEYLVKDDQATWIENTAGETEASLPMSFIFRRASDVTDKPISFHHFASTRSTLGIPDEYTPAYRSQMLSQRPN